MVPPELTMESHARYGPKPDPEGLVETTKGWKICFRTESGKPSLLSTIKISTEFPVAVTFNMHDAVRLVLHGFDCVETKVLERAKE